MSTTTPIPAPGFDDPTRGAQRVFRAVLDALAHPGRRYPLAVPPAPPTAFGPGLAAVALTLFDEECSVWIAGAAGDDAELAAWLAFHTGVSRATHPADADFVVVTRASRPALADLAQGTDVDPHRSATLVLDVRDLDGQQPLTASGPGIDGSVDVAAPWVDAAFLDEWRQNGARFPRGVDLLLVEADHVAAFPRTTRLAASDTAQEA
ncbi:phosphonate C-P lyase system protein PhnH [Curtobacterium sp. VKM Ac-2865]|uniref:phosphonate C-P lyase system protein PhnH n=1 Tax=Curtobacterium sp. VKM Ac-2865 TaxID=2783817 RepID=UPI00188CF19E|nr:phosphonate C-P lyase system protein PhnH [Curtobacterium sp. VKM Ac-2865]MBF4582781.1 phosphonate C-P lyase system protein PhnH [Curtobacterium sp. VKM Ac-2865]